MTRLHQGKEHYTSRVYLLRYIFRNLEQDHALLKMMDILILRCRTLYAPISQPKNYLLKSNGIKISITIRHNLST